MDEMPRNKLRVKPDFLAPSPHVAYENKIKIQDISQNDYDEDEEDHDLLNPPQVRYYESQKLLGQLYRKIDENKFLSRIQGYSREPGVPLLRRVFHHILDKNPDRFDKKSKETITNFAHFALDLCKRYVYYMILNDKQSLTKFNLLVIKPTFKILVHAMLNIDFTISENQRSLMDVFSVRRSKHIGSVSFQII